MSCNFRANLGPENRFEAIGIIDSRLPTVSVWLNSKSTHVEVPGDISNSGKSGFNDVPDKNFPSDPGTEIERNPAYYHPGFRKFAPTDGQEFQKGVIFYLHDRRIVGILLFNLPDKLSRARQVLDQSRPIEDLHELKHVFSFS